MRVTDRRTDRRTDRILIARPQMQRGNKCDAECNATITHPTYLLLAAL